MRKLKPFLQVFTVSADGQTERSPRLNARLNESIRPGTGREVCFIRKMIDS